MVKLEVSFGQVKIDRKTYYSDVIVYWDGRKEQIASFNVLDLNLLAKVLSGKPTDIVLFTGMRGSVKVKEEAADILEEKGIDLFAESNERAAKIFNSFAADGRKVAGLIHCGR